jgi:hypothetical protein
VDQPQFDRLVLTSGSRFEGLVVEEQPQQIRFQYLERKPGVRTLVFDTYFERGEIASLSKAQEPGRSRAKKVIENLRLAKEREEAKTREIKLVAAPWVSDPPLPREGVRGGSWRYQGSYFILHSNAQDDLIRLICVRLDEIFAAYVKTLGRRQEAARPTNILIFASLAEYQGWQQKRGMQFLNPAVYDPAANPIIVGCDLGRLGTELAALRKKNEEQLREIGIQKEKLSKHFQGQPPASQLRQLQSLHRQVQSVGAENEKTLAQLQTAFFATLYHEAFHAYLDNWVYPAAQFEVPRWLNEGLAQLFESSFVEIGELRIGRIDPARLQSIQDEVRRGRFLTLRDILLSPPQQFFARHTLEAFEADRQYAAAWALAHFLTYDLKLLDSPRMPEYLQRRTPPAEPVAAFEKLTGLTIQQCEARWLDYLLRLRTDGSLRTGGQ